MQITSWRSSLVYFGLVLALVFCAVSVPSMDAEPVADDVKAAGLAGDEPVGQGLKVYYLEIVTPSVDETCATLAQVHGVAFTAPVPELGQARTAELVDGGLIGVRAPMRETELPVVRPYVLVDDLDAAIQAAEASGAEVAMYPMAIPGRGRFAIYLLGGVAHGLWQL